MKAQNNPTSFYIDLRRLWVHVSPARRRTLYTVFGLMIAGAIAEVFTLGAVIPYLALVTDPQAVDSYPILRHIFDRFGWTHSSQILVPATLLFSVIIVFCSLILLTLLWMTQEFVFALGHELSTKVLTKTITQPYTFHLQHHSSNQIVAVNKIDAVVSNIIYQLMQVITAVVVATCICSALILIDPVTAILIALVLGSVYSILTYITRRRIRTNSELWAVMQGRRIKAVQEGLGGIREVIIDHMQSNFVNAYSSYDLLLRRAQAQNTFIGLAPRYLVETAGILLVAWIAMTAGVSRTGFVGALPFLGAFALGMLRLLPHIQRIYSGWTVISSNRHALYDVLGILELPEYSDCIIQDPRLRMSFSRDIVLERISFRYSADRKLALADVSLSIIKGSRIGIIGATGSGKSTLVDLIMGLISPTDGRILVDGVELSDETVSSWRSEIAHVPQSIFLIDSSVRRNIAFGVADDLIQEERVLLAARQAGIHEFIETLPDGYATEVGERGVRLSGGQRQRIGIARALYKDAKLLVLDEATSAVDTATEAEIIKSIDALGRDLTIIIIAHRLASVAICDRVINLEDGRVARLGTS